MTGGKERETGTAFAGHLLEGSPACAVHHPCQGSRQRCRPKETPASREQVCHLRRYPTCLVHAPDAFPTLRGMLQEEATAYQARGVSWGVDELNEAMGQLPGGGLSV